MKAAAPAPAPWARKLKKHELHRLGVPKVGFEFDDVGRPGDGHQKGQRGEKQQVSAA
jgi:hypothetical protein